MELSSHLCSGDGRVRIDERSALARYVDWQARPRNRRLAALGTPGSRRCMLFVEDEVLINARDARLRDELERRYGGEVIPEPPIGPLPDLAHRHPARRSIDVAEMPSSLRVRLRRVPPPGEALEQLSIAAGRRRRSAELESLCTSELGAGVAAVVIRHRLDGGGIGLNHVGETFTMPLDTAAEGTGLVYGANPFQWPAFAGRTRMVDAWQLVDSIRRIVGDRFVTLGVLDGGFWLDGNGVPLVAAGQPASDLGAGVMQLNLQAEGTPAGGPNPSQCGSSACPWHGNAVVSAAAAALGDNAGAAGSGGSVASSFLFRTDLSEAQVLRCVRMCAAWGIDVLNMSFGITIDDWELTFGSDEWEDTFRFAADNGVVLIAAAGNSQLDLPDDEAIRPATRTPGVLTIGALDASNNAWVGTGTNGSNHGSSVGLWAPGVNIEVMPDGNNAQGRRATGTSFASPIAAGVAAMMRYANPALSAHDVRRILVDTAWPGAGRVSRGLDAFGAVFAAVQGTLPDNEEPNNVPAAARDLIPVGAGGALVPAIGGFTSRSRAGDQDYWRFKLTQLSRVTATADWYQRLSTLWIDIEGTDPDARGPGEMVRSGSSTSGRQVLDGLLAAGTYLIRIGGNAGTAYRLQVTTRPAALEADAFEVNDSFESAARLVFGNGGRFAPLRLRAWGPGTFDATIHRSRRWWVLGAPGVMNDDYFVFDAPAQDALRQPTIGISDSDVPLDVTLFDASRQPEQTWTGVRTLTIRPQPKATHFLRVSAAQPTRYRISAMMAVDPRILPPPLQEELVFKLPDWWLDPPLEMHGPVIHYAVEVGASGQGDSFVFARTEPGLRLELLNQQGEVVRQGRVEDAQVRLSTADLESGRYLLRVIRKAEAGSSTRHALRMEPPLR